MTTVISGSNPSITFSDSTTQNTSPFSTSTFGFKNRIINGGMVIDQRNAGASVTVTTAGLFSVDRWETYGSPSSKFSAQQDAGSVTPPVGFKNYLGCTSLSAYTLGATDQEVIDQPIEGLNVYDLAWGTANAQPITISFWVRSSLTGTFGGSVQNSAANRCYPYSYTISSANTWEYKTITIAGDTTGTWLTTNGVGLRLYISLGTGSTYSATSGVWGAGPYITAPTGATSVVGTNGATFYITGVQLEVGSQATNFDYRDYGRELILCQRYYYLHAGTFVNPNSTAITPIGIGSQEDSTLAITHVPFKVNMRSVPTLVVSTGTDYYRFTRSGGTDLFNSFSLDTVSTTIASIYNATEISGTAGWAGRIMTNNTSASVAFNTEL